MLLESVRELIGIYPAGYEVFEYVFVGIFGVIIVSSCISLISGLFRLFGGGGK